MAVATKGQEHEICEFEYDGNPHLQEAFEKFAECVDRGFFDEKEPKFSRRNVQDCLTALAFLEAVQLVIDLGYDQEENLSRATLGKCLDICFHGSRTSVVKPTQQDRNMVARLLMGFIDPNTGRCFTTPQACVAFTADDSFMMRLLLATKPKREPGKAWLISSSEAFFYINCFYVGLLDALTTRMYCMVDTADHPLDCHCKGQHVNKRFAVPDAASVAELLERTSFVGANASKPFGASWIHMVGRVFAAAAARDHKPQAAFMELCDVLAKPVVQRAELVPRCIIVPKMPPLLPSGGLPDTAASAKFVYQCMMWCK